MEGSLARQQVDFMRVQVRVGHHGDGQAADASATNVGLGSSVETDKRRQIVGPGETVRLKSQTKVLFPYSTSQLKKAPSPIKSEQRQFAENKREIKDLKHTKIYSAPLVGREM